ncbi:MAG: metallophosphoesterase family protein [Deltaproteobacteria bacterium]|nr:metallophosphoesterase family protein [Deltaproteobacteria bacterium]
MAQGKKKFLFPGLAASILVFSAGMWAGACNSNDSSPSGDVDSDSDTDVDTDTDTDTGSENPLDKQAVSTAGPYLLKPGPDSIEVWWETDLAASSRVSYGEGESLDHMAVGEIIKDDYEGAYLVKPPSGFRHKVVISGLEQGKSYSYKVISVKEPLKAGHFSTAPKQDEDVEIAVFGDDRSNDEDHHLVVQTILKDSPALVVNTGDMVPYGKNDDDWRNFFKIEADLVRNTPMYPVMGNHESALEGSFKFGSYFGGMLKKDQAAYYSFEFGPVHGVVLDTNRDLEQGSDQLNWLETDLESVSHRKKQPALLAFFHHPLYTFSNHDPEKQLREILLPIFQKYGVDAVFWGHNHCYERFSIKGVPYITTGGGGAPLYSVGQATGDDAQYFVTGEKALHYILLDVSPTAIDGQVIHVPDHSVMDTFKIEGY